MVGKPIVWANGTLQYYTDQGDLSAMVTRSQANSMIAAAAAVWNAVPTAAVNISAGGSLSETSAEPMYPPAAILLRFRRIFNPATLRNRSRLFSTRTAR